jgi:hypothetical protein
MFVSLTLEHLKRCCLTRIHANGADVNVLSWNKLVGNLWQLAGGDDGVLSAWDLRHFSGEDIKPGAVYSTQDADYFG